MTPMSRGGTGLPPGFECNRLAEEARIPLARPHGLERAPRGPDPTPLDRQKPLADAVEDRTPRHVVDRQVVQSASHGPAEASAVIPSSAATSSRNARCSRIACSNPFASSVALASSTT